MQQTTLIIASFITLSLSAQTVSDFSLTNIEKETVTYEQIKGEKLTIIDFWATWCQPCRSSIPKINKLYETFKDQGLQIIGISIDSPRNQAKVGPFSNALGIKYPVLLDPDQEVSDRFNFSSIPIMFFINANNEIVFTHEGYTPGDETELKGIIEKHLGL